MWGKCTAGEWLLLQTLKPHTGASLVAQMVKDLSTVLVTWVRSPGQEDPLEKGMATHSSTTLAWRIPWMEKLDRLQSVVLGKVGHNCATNFYNN